MSLFASIQSAASRRTAVPGFSALSRGFFPTGAVGFDRAQPSCFTGLPLSRRSHIFRQTLASAAEMSAEKDPSVAGKGTKGRALVSVSDKSGLAELAKGLSNAGFELISTGGSAAAMESAGFEVTRVEQLTGFPEMLDGRVKTLHPMVHGGILAKRENEDHMATVESNNIPMIDVVVVNLYPFRSTVLSKPPVDFDTAIENIDIGGPAMIRAAAKNHKDVTVIVDPADYEILVNQLSGKATDEEEIAFRKKMAWKAFQHCATYDSQVSEYLWSEVGEGLPPAFSVPVTVAQSLRYGENPHQSAAFYSDDTLASAKAGGVGKATQHHGKEMSYNNYLDADAAYACVCDIEEPACVVVKHTNPCGVACRDNLLEAYELAVKADPISAFGGIVAFNRPVDEDLANHIRQFRSPTDGETKMFYEIVIAPGYTPEGLATLKGKSKTLRILEAQPKIDGAAVFRQVSGGYLRQEEDALKAADIEFTCVSEAQPTPEQVSDLKFAWTCVKHVKSNAIVIAKDQRMLGMGSGQPNRVKSVNISLEKAGNETKGSVMASDAFFPFSWNDSVEIACRSGVKAIVHPGGSMRDSDAVDCCNKYGVVLMTTGVRHFRH
ncbi:hypothetical protein BSKO_13611 [Bryopsis sp. KO-2023]|nr:hypothetical protein BSKO_13611 [Bryopsis sp. KO-2023]